MSAGVRMWEARVTPGRLDDALAWVTGVVVPAARAAGATSCEVCCARGPEERVVLITRWAGDGAWAEPEPPPGVVSRAHAWPFTPVPLDPD